MDTRTPAAAQGSSVLENGLLTPRSDHMEAILVAVCGVVILFISISQTVAARRKARQLEASYDQRIQAWIGAEGTRIADEQRGIARREAAVQFQTWKTQEEQVIRQDAIARSHSVIVGKVTEHFVPFLPEFSWNPKDARFVGAPVDFIVFDGLDEGQLRSITFVEVKTGSSVLTAREKQIRDAIEARRIEWREIRTGIPASSSLPTPTAPAALPPTTNLIRRFFK